MTVFHWVRHGPTHEKTFVGWRDVPADLSDRDRIERLSAHLPADALLISSDLIRASDTADVLALPTRTRLPSDRDLRELHFGVWDGMTFTEVAARDPDLSRAYWETPGHVAAPEGESWNQTATRVNAVVDRLITDHPDAHVIATAHFGVILTQVQRALGIDPCAAMTHYIDNLSVTEVRVEPGGWTVERLNHCP